MKRLSKNAAVPLLALLGIALSGLIVLFFWLNSLDGQSQGNPQAIYIEAVNLAIDEEGKWAFNSEVTDGNHPWQIFKTTTAGNATEWLTNFTTDNKSVVSLEKNLTGQLLKFKGSEYLAVDPSFEPILSEILNNVISTNMLPTIDFLNSQKVVNTLVMTEENGQLLRHYQLSYPEDVKLIGMSAISGSKTAIDDAHVLKIKSSDVWIIENSGEIDRIETVYSLGEEEFTVTTSPAKKIEFTPAVSTGLLSDWSTTNKLNIVTLLNQHGLSNLADKLQDVNFQTQLIEVNNFVTSFSKSNFYYPTREELITILTEGNHKELIALLTKNKATYSGGPDNCDNITETTYCETYSLTLDLKQDGYDKNDQDQDPVDVIYSS